jgi:hypothetical protein
MKLAFIAAFAFAAACGAGTFAYLDAVKPHDHDLAAATADRSTLVVREGSLRALAPVTRP